MPPRLPMRFLDPEEVKEFGPEEIEAGRTISQRQLDGARLYSNREEYIKTLPQNLKYMEIGVAWGYYSDLVCKTAKPKQADLVDIYEQDLKCWSWRKFGECKCENQKHELLYTPETHESWIIEQFSKYPGVRTIRGYAPECLPEDDDYDYIYIDTGNDRFHIREMLKKTSKMIKVGGVIGLNDYNIWDSVILDIPHGTFQSVNEFLEFNPNWVVDAKALHPLNFDDIYLRRVS